MKSKQKLPKKELLTLGIGELIAVGLTIIAFWLVDVSGLFDFEFSFRVITGALLGALVIFLNFLFLSFSVNRAVDLFLTNRGEGEMSEEEAAEFASKNTSGVEHAMTKSFIVRCASIGAALIRSSSTGSIRLRHSFPCFAISRYSLGEIISRRSSRDRRKMQKPRQQVQTIRQKLRQKIQTI